MRRAIAVLASALLLTACGTSKASVSATPSTTSSSGNAAPSPAAGGPFAATGAYGHEPTISFPSATPPTSLVKSVVTEGSGPAVAKGDLLVGHYVGQVWGATTPFDSSFKRGSLASFPIGVGKVVPGWDETLVGVKTGSRVLLSLPPEKGYGATGNSGAGIKGTDTIVFVVDVVGAYAPMLAGQADAAVQSATTPGVTVGGAPGKQPTVAVAKGATEPAKPTATLLAKGTGPLLGDGLTLLQIQAVDWSNAPAGSTWTKDGLQAVPLGGGSPLDVLKGVPVGSRVLVLLPKDTGKSAAHPALAAVIDVVAQPSVPA